MEAFTPSRLLGCDRQPVIMGRADYYQDVDQAYPLVRGNMVHALMERARYPGAVAIIRERRMLATIGSRYGVHSFMGKPDLVVVESIEHREQGPLLHVKIVDYKSTGTIHHDLTEAKADHQRQVNMYAWLVAQCLPSIIEGLAGIEGATVAVDELEIVYADMSRMRRFTSKGWLKDRGKLVQRSPRRYDMLDLSPVVKSQLPTIEWFIRRRIEARIEAREQLPPFLEGDDAWRCLYCPVADACRQIGYGQP